MTPRSSPALKALAEAFGATSVVTRTAGAEVIVCASGLAKSGAEDLLDWLANHGCGTGEVSADGAGFTVTFRVAADL
jgi:hypothetical protein